MKKLIILLIILLVLPIIGLASTLTIYESEYTFFDQNMASDVFSMVNSFRTGSGAWY